MCLQGEKTTQAISHVINKYLKCMPSSHFHHILPIRTIFEMFSIEGFGLKHNRVVLNCATKSRIKINIYFYFSIFYWNPEKGSINIFWKCKMKQVLYIVLFCTMYCFVHWNGYKLLHYANGIQRDRELSSLGITALRIKTAPVK